MKPSNAKPTERLRSLQGSLGRAGPYLGIGMQLAGSMGFYVLAGYLADRWLGTTPWLLLAGSGVGMVAFFVQVYRLVARLNEESRTARAERHARDEPTE